jgi:hypothetical protein
MRRIPEHHFGTILPGKEQQRVGQNAIEFLPQRSGK